MRAQAPTPSPRAGGLGGLECRVCSLGSSKCMFRVKKTPPDLPPTASGSRGQSRGAWLWKAGRRLPLWEHREAGTRSSLSLLPRGHVHLVVLLFS